MKRRPFIAGSSALALAAGRASAQVPARNPGIVIRGAYIMTMDPSAGDLKSSDIHVRGNSIVAIGPRIDVEGAEVVDATGMIAMPGIVDTHWHMWNSLLRGLVGGTPQDGYFPTVRKYGPHYTALDTYAGTRLALVEALNAGVTTVHNWAHNIRDVGHADASIRAHQSVGLRARFSYGSAQGMPPDKPQDLRDMARLHSDVTVIAAHWRHPVTDYPLSGDAATAVIAATTGLHQIGGYRDDDVVIEVFDTRSAESVAARTSVPGA